MSLHVWLSKIPLLICHKWAFFLFFFIFYFLFIYFFLNFKILNSYMRSQTWTPLPPPSPQHLSGSSPCTWVQLAWGRSFFFNWRITALQRCVGFCRTTIQISHKSTHRSPLCWASLPQTPTFSPLGVTGHEAGLPVLHSRLLPAVYFACGIDVSATLSVHSTLSFPRCVHKPVLYVCIYSCPANTFLSAFS